jgi:hypothetical protein
MVEVPHYTAQASVIGLRSTRFLQPETEAHLEKRTGHAAKWCKVD